MDCHFQRIYLSFHHILKLEKLLVKVIYSGLLLFFHILFFGQVQSRLDVWIMQHSLPTPSKGKATSDSCKQNTILYLLFKSMRNVANNMNLCVITRPHQANAYSFQAIFVFYLNQMVFRSTKFQSHALPIAPMASRRSASCTTANSGDISPFACPASSSLKPEKKKKKTEIDYTVHTYVRFPYHTQQKRTHSTPQMTEKQRESDEPINRAIRHSYIK